MKSLFLILFFFTLIFSHVFAQKKVYYNQTEFGAMFGRSADDWMGESENRMDFSMITFHGVRFGKKNNQVGGISVGFDQYETTSVIPLSFGWRGLFGRGDRAKLVTGFDLGGGLMFLEETVKNEWGASWHESGVMFSPSVGGFFPGKKGKTALTVTLAYKSQRFSTFTGTYDQSATPSPSPFGTSKFPDGFSYLSETEYLFNSLVLRMGFSF